MADDLVQAVRSAAHELNNALNVLRLTTDLLEQEHMDREAAVAQMRRQVDEATQVVVELQRLAVERNKGAAPP